MAGPGGESYRRRAEDVGQEAEPGAIPGVEVRAGARRVLGLDEVDHLLRVGAHPKQGLGIGPAGEDRFDVLVASHADLHGLALDAAQGSPIAGVELDVQADAAEIRSVSDGAKLDQAIGVGPVVAEELDSASLDLEEAVNVAVLIKVREGGMAHGEAR